MTNDFDVFIDDGGVIDIFAVLQSGGLSHIRLGLGQVTGSPVLENRSSDSRVCCVRVMKINSRFHLFYCLDCSDRLLVHQVIDGGDYSMEPKVIDRIGKRYVYDVFCDADGNIHILYTTDEGYMALRSYIYSEKSYTPPKRIADYDARSLAVTLYGGRLYAAFAAVEKGHNAVFACDVSSGRCIAVSRRVHMRTEVCIFPLEECMCVQWVENGMCFGTELRSSMEHSKVMSIGKSRGMLRPVVCRGLLQVSRLPSTTSGQLFANAEGAMKCREESYDMHPKGYEVDAMAQRYMEVLSKGNEFPHDFKEDLMRIEASLERLVMLAEKAMEEYEKKTNDDIECVITAHTEYNNVEED
ncbi:MAG: hypothetical protein IJ454_01905 [Clostridia bacterium]|nr:hypothetical protein [Clostridia bacterium]